MIPFFPFVRRESARTRCAAAPNVVFSRFRNRSITEPNP